MISLKKYLDSPLTCGLADVEPAERDLLSVAMDAYRSALLEMGSCSLDACPGLGDDLKKDLEALRAVLSTGMSCEALRVTGSSVQGRLRLWGRDCAKHYRQKADDVKDLLLAMARTAESVSARDQRCAGQMSQVTERLKTIASLEDLTEIRVSIKKSATELKTSIDRMTSEGKETLDNLRGLVTRYQTKLAEAEEVASRDALTGLRSRHYVEDQIEKRIENSSEFCVAIIDIDDFKRVNDNHGHLAGDELLKQFSVELRSARRTTDVIGRWGGDEFIVIFDCALTEAEGQTERLHKWVCGNYEVKAKSGTVKLRMDASIGLAAHLAGEGLKELVEQADAAMYAQKEASRRNENGAKR